MLGAALLTGSDHTADVAWPWRRARAADRLPAMVHDLAHQTGTGWTPSLPELRGSVETERRAEARDADAAGHDRRCVRADVQLPGSVIVAPLASEPGLAGRGCSGSTESVHFEFGGSRMIPLPKSEAGALTVRVPRAIRKPAQPVAPGTRTRSIHTVPAGISG